jgi:hypothetical protein
MDITDQRKKYRETPPSFSHFQQRILQILLNHFKELFDS